MYNQFNNPFMNQALGFSRPNQFQQQHQDQGLQFVNGLESAQAYQMMPNQRVILMDSNMPRFYLKETDAAGMASIKAYDFTEANNQQVNPDYITRAEFDEWREKYESVNAKTKRTTKSTNSSGVSEND